MSKYYLKGNFSSSLLIEKTLAKMGNCCGGLLKDSEKRNSHPHGGPPGHQRRGSNDSNERGGGRGHGPGHGPGHKK
ncbi:unnamed protein product [Adineta ricciae]|uniref:Uncharacterized protein n=1 Tax=Adineta ricciae TaxID=249248 RepID=A0A814GTR5_ADIRI|nr:unnamed protein product [Adineta ricciae]